MEDKIKNCNDYTHGVLQLKSVKDIWGAHASINVSEMKNDEYTGKFVRCRTVRDLQLAGWEVGTATDPLPYDPIPNNTRPWTSDAYFHGKIEKEVKFIELVPIEEWDKKGYINVSAPAKVKTIDPWKESQKLANEARERCIYRRAASKIEINQKPVRPLNEQEYPMPDIESAGAPKEGRYVPCLIWIPKHQE